MKKTIFTLFVLAVSVNLNLHAQKYAALTFDDAPDSSYTEKILDILKKENVKATFFVLGRKVVQNPEIVKRINNEGHLIGNHSTAHKNFTEYTDTASLLKDVLYVDSVLYATIGKKTLYLRPPYGALKVKQKQLLEARGYKMALWTLSTKDWDVFNVTKESIVAKVKKHHHNNAIILLHSKNAAGKIEDYPLRNNTIEALPEIITFLKENNYQLVTLDKLKPETGIGGDEKTIEKGLAKRKDIFFYGGFEEYFGNIFWAKKWGVKWEIRADSCNISPTGILGKNALRVSFPENSLGPETGGASFPVVFRDIQKMGNGHYEKGYLRYYVKFEEGFDFGKGGKLPGLMGGGDSWSRSGGNQPVGDNGWTLRLMWLENGKLIVYAYVPKSKNGKWGEAQWGQAIDCGINAQPGKWHCIEQFVDVGTPNHDNGKLKIWIDGEEKVNIDDMRFWNVKNDMGKIGGIYFSTFHGGNTPEWKPQNDSFIQFDGFVVAKKRVGTAD